ncbi:MAG: MFS transporter [Betaproteobacteria bacterium]|nr:MFS transporter [Betaproteobacteria bacterium]NBY06532.1 MFS transporter [Betaproteobacteria bacterium]
MKIFYGWRITAAACSIQFILSSLLTQSFGVYVAVLADDEGWSKTALSGAAAMQSVEAAIIGPLLGWMIDRFGSQKMIRTGILFFGFGFLIFSQITTLTGFYISSVLMAIGASMSGYFPLSVSLIQWFDRYRARALSIMSLGIAMGGLLVPMIALSIQHYGWRTTALASGIIAFIIGFPLAGIIKSRPEDVGLTADGEPHPSKTETTHANVNIEKKIEFTTQQALRTRAFWFLALGHGFALAIVTAVNVHAITHMKESLGYSVSQASLAILLMTIAQIAGVLFGAAVGDRFEKRKVSAACMLLHAIGLLLLTYATHPIEIAAFAIIHGAAWGLRGPFMQAIRADYFGRNAIGMILGLSAVIVALGQVAGPLVAGVLADVTGDYKTGFTVLSIMVGLGSLLFMFAKKPKHPES